ncbi:hypothetical protein, partial [Vibrio paucivorans]
PRPDSQIKTLVLAIYSPLDMGGQRVYLDRVDRHRKCNHQWRVVDKYEHWLYLPVPCGSLGSTFPSLPPDLLTFLQVGINLVIKL